MYRINKMSLLPNKKIIKRVFSGKTLEASVYSQKYQLVHIRIVNLADISKLSIWTELYKGENTLTIDISSLQKGPYKITVAFPEENTREEIFNVN